MYNINQVATMTGLSTRTIRSHIKQGFLDGEKIDGVWMFSEDALSQYFSHNAIRPSIEAKRHGIVYDFLAQRKKIINKICMVMDFLVDEEEANDISNYFCKAVSSYPEGSELRFSFGYDTGYCRVILSGPEDAVKEIWDHYDLS